MFCSSQCWSCANTDSVMRYCMVNHFLCFCVAWLRLWYGPRVCNKNCYYCIIYYKQKKVTISCRYVLRKTGPSKLSTAAWISGTIACAGFTFVAALPVSTPSMTYVDRPAYILRLVLVNLFCSGVPYFAFRKCVNPNHALDLLNVSTLLIKFFSIQICVCVWNVISTTTIHKVFALHNVSEQRTYLIKCAGFCWLSSRGFKLVSSALS